MVLGFVCFFFPWGIIVTQKSLEGCEKMHLLDSVLFEAAAQLLGVDSSPGME